MTNCFKIFFFYYNYTAPASLFRKSYREAGNFDQGALVLFYTEWCHHCNNMKPHYAQVSRLVKENELSKNVQVLALDCDGFGRDICRKQYNVKNFPTMHFYYPKQNVEYKRKCGTRMEHCS